MSSFVFKHLFTSREATSRTLGTIKGSGYLLQHFIRISAASQSMSATPSKVAKLEKPTIGTHDNAFHCDDVTACHMLKSLKRFKDHDIIRTRDPDLLAQAEIVVDVGGELDVERLRLDHHQRSFTQTIHDYHPKIKTTNPKKGPRLSSAGLVYAVFGKDYIVKQLGLGETFDDVKDDEDKRTMIDAIYAKAYVEFMEEIDSIDNGVEIVEGNDVQYNYHINSDVSTRVGRFNPRSKTATPEERLVQFRKAMDMVGSEMIEGIQFLHEHWYPRSQAFRKFVLTRKEFDPSGAVVFIDADSNISWKSSIYDLEEELGIQGEIKYIVYQDKAASSPWRVIGVPVELKSFSTRCPLKQEWCGHRDEELQALSGVPDATFVHASGFTGGALSKEGVLALIHKSMNK